MRRPRPPKKTETLEVRLPHAVKQAFMARAHEQGRTASAVLREFIDSYLADSPPREARPMLRRLVRPVAATSIAASALALYAVTPTAVAAAPDLKALFDNLDRNRDGLLSAEEFVERNSDAGRLGAVDALFVRSESRVNGSGKPFVALVKAGAAPLPGALPAEVRANLRRPFDAQDTDRSGAVTFPEFETYHVAVLREGFDLTDADLDGAIDRSEFDQANRELPPGSVARATPFEEADRNRDGRIGWDEFLG